MRQTLAAALSFTLLASLAAAQTPLTTERVGSGLVKPLWAGQPPGDTARLFVIEQQQADIEIVDLSTGLKLATPYLNLDGTKVNVGANERGLLGMAFDPDYANTGHFWINYTRAGDGDTIIERYTVLGDPATSNTADPNSGVIVFGPIDQPQSNHNGGGILVGPDGKLWIATGDGGNSNDTGAGHHEPGGNSQWGLTHLGKMLRINKDGSVPGDNPFLGDPNVLDEIWATGLRNPWRFAFDRETGDLWIGDVGQNVREEIDFQPASSTGAENYGWRCMEAFNCTGLTGCTCNDPALTLPVTSYGHGTGKCSVTGGFVYRGQAIPDLAGNYFYSDYCTAQIWSFRYNGVALTDFLERTAELDPAGALTIDLVTSFGEDDNGELYICDQNGEVFRLKPAGPFLGLGDALAGTSGKPILHGEGTLVAGSPGSLEMTNAAPSAIASLFISIGVGEAPFKQGVLHAVPPAFILPLVTTASGTLDLTWASWPMGMPPGSVLCFQYAISDAGGPAGVALSNALKATTP